MNRRDMDIDDLADEAYDASVVEMLDDWSEAIEENAQRDGARRAASGISAEVLSLIDAGNAGRKAGMLGHGASMNPYSDPLSPEFQEWERQRMATIGARLGQQPRRFAA